MTTAMKGRPERRASFAGLGEQRHKSRYGDYWNMIPAEILLIKTLEEIEKLSPSQRAWLTQVWRGLPGHSVEVQKWYDPDDGRPNARQHLMRLGYRPASEEVKAPVRKARRGRGSY
jgi:hypothetical protein